MMKNARPQHNQLQIISIFLIVFLSMTVHSGCKQKKSPASNSEKVGTVESEKSDDSIANNALLDACLKGKTAQVIEALNNDADINCRDRDGNTPMMLAAFDGYSDIVKMLLDKGAKADILNPRGRTALMFASSGPFPGTVELLLKAGADPNIADQEEAFTALMFAAAEGQKEVVEVLLKYGADPELQDIDGDNASDFAVQNGHEVVVIILSNLDVKKD
jgi:ankyrin repeat protein